MFRSMSSVVAIRALAAALFVVVVAAGSAAAHSLPQRSNPSAGATLTAAPAAVTITFGETPDPRLSTIRVLDRAGNVVSSGPATVVPGDGLTLSVALVPVGSGVYTVAWRTVSAVDGHSASGSFAFGVGITPPPPAPGSNAAPGAAVPAPGGSPPSALTITGRWYLFLGLIGLLGGAAFGLLVAAPDAAVSRRFLPVAWLVAAIGTTIVLADQIAESGATLGEVLGTSLGSAIWVRSVPLIVAGLGTIAVARRTANRAALAVTALGAASALLADVLLSHAAAGASATTGIAVQGLHVLAVGMWLGGLAGLLLTLRGVADERTAGAARRFARLATAGIATVAITGLIRAIAEVGTFDRLVTTDYGHLVIAKTALLGLLAVLGAVNHFRNVPAAGRTLQGLRRAGSIELLVGATVVLLSASLVNLAPPAAVAAASEASTGGPEASPRPTPSPTPAPLVVNGSDFGTSVRLRLVVVRGLAGADTFMATVTDYDSGAPIAASGVSLRFTPPRSDVGTSRLDLVPAGPGVFSGSGTNLSLDGTWGITAVVANGTASVEVPLELTTPGTPSGSPSPSAQIDVNVVPGLPTIYAVHLPAGRKVEVYADPGTAGPNEIHVTFFDASGNELPVTNVTMTLGPVGGTLTPLAPRELEPGHFVADAKLPAGTYSLAVSAPAPGGEELATRLEVTVAP